MPFVVDAPNFFRAVTDIPWHGIDERNISLVLEYVITVASLSPLLFHNVSEGRFTSRNREQQAQRQVLWNGRKTIRMRT